MRMKDANEELDCTNCGACCTGSSALGHYVPVTALDRKRLPTKYAKKTQPLEPVIDGQAYALGLKRVGEHEACVALKGTIGKDVRCDVYAQRPVFCRALERGSNECHERRRDVFFIRPAINGD